jgi:tRNA (guanine-N7-)-methyltransferase
MGRKQKLKRFAEVAAFSNVFEHMEGTRERLSNETGVFYEGKNHWAQKYFGNDHPIVLELACGKGEYTLALAQSNPDKNFIGVDIKGARIWKGARRGLEENISNAAFLRTRIEFIEYFFSENEIDAIWITFPDPFEGKITRRLTSPPFLDRYRKILKPGGTIHLKTDSTLLYEFTLDVIYHDPQCKVLYADSDIYNKSLYTPELENKTFYETKHLAEGRKIKYIEFLISPPSPL